MTATATFTPTVTPTTTPTTWACVDGNEAVARVAYALSDVIAIYPITPATSMGEAADAWSAADRPNLWGAVPSVVEMQSEAGAAGALHGAVQKGALGTTFTASQGLLLMLPNMFKIAGELTPAVIHVAARTVATHALSIFGDHSDVMAVRSSGFAMLAASSVQEAHDFALVAHAASLRTRIPFLHFFDGFRTSHEIAKIELLGESDLLALVREEDVAAHRGRGLSPDRPMLRGSAQNPDVYFQAREAVNPFYEAVPGAVQGLMDDIAARTGRRYNTVDYVGAPDAERVIVLMGSGCGAVEETVDALTAQGERVGVLKVRLYRPFPIADIVAAIPETVRSVAVLDRTKEPGAAGEPLYQDVVTALFESGRPLPRIIAGRYGLSSKEFTPAMVKAVYDELAAPDPKQHFTVGINDDVSGLSLAYDAAFTTDAAPVRAVFYGLGSDGTVGANKMAVHLVGDNTQLFVQGYFVYDSKKSGSTTVSHLRFGPAAIRSTYLIEDADFVGCHQWHFLERIDVLRRAAPGATFLLNTPYGPDEVWDKLPYEVQRDIVSKRLRLHVIDAQRVAREVGLGSHINSVMLPCFLALSNVLPLELALTHLKTELANMYGKRGPAVVAQNIEAVDRSLAELHEVDVPTSVSATRLRRDVVPIDATDFVARVTAQLLADNGDSLPVSAMPVDGAFPTGTTRFEKRAIAAEIPVWDPQICIDCGKCAVVCPHAAIQLKVYRPEALTDGPVGFASKEYKSTELTGYDLTIQVAPDDCTGCGVCVDVCPAHSKTEVRHKAIMMAPAEPLRAAERANFEFFLGIPQLDRAAVSHNSVKASQLLQPLFEFSGACAGCGETPYLKLISQLFGDRMIVANATGCSSIYGGNLPTTPWTTNDEGRGPAWSNSLFEDNAEFGLGIRLAHDQLAAEASALVASLRDTVGAELADTITAGVGKSEEADIVAQRTRVALLKRKLDSLTGGSTPAIRRLLSLADELVARSVWIVGGDGWAYDIGFGGVDHVLASGRNVNLLVLDTEVYSNTGGQASKATPRGAVAKFATAGKEAAKKDLGMLAMAYGNVYVAHVAIGANDRQTVKALLEAEAWEGPSLVIAYSTCIAHGIDMSTSMSHQKDAVRSGYWPLYRYHPGESEHERPFHLDSTTPSMPVRDFAASEGRFAVLARTMPERFERLQREAQADIDERWRLYEQLAVVERTAAGSAAIREALSE